ncbi:MAG: hypothetical protein D6770_08110 [Anaerolineae bacterium]|nr:MAG: hypothetical protein D6770_08110 [Anaerolineae bacterium]
MLRQFAQEKLREVPDEESRIRRRHCAYHAASLSQGAVPFAEVTHPETPNEIAHEIDDLRAGWQ